MTLTFDIETAPPVWEHIERMAPEELREAPEKPTGDMIEAFKASLPKSIKKEETIQKKVDEYVEGWDVEERRQAWLEKSALSRSLGEVIAIGWQVGDDDIQCSFSDGQEAALLGDIVDHLENAKTLVGHNILEFDLPFLYARCCLYGITFPVAPWWDRWGIADTYKTWRCGMGSRDKEPASLDHLARFFGLEPKQGNGADFHTWEREIQVEYLTHDVRLARQVAEKLQIYPETLPF